MIILNNLEQPILIQFFQKFTLWGSPCSCPTPWCLWGWTSPRWSWMSGKTLNQPSFTCWTTFASTTFSKNQSLGMSGVRSSRNLSEPPTLIRAGNPDLLLSRIDPGVKTFLLVPHTWWYIAWAPQLTITIAEFNRDSDLIERTADGFGNNDGVGGTSTLSNSLYYYSESISGVLAPLVNRADSQQVKVKLKRQALMVCAGSGLNCLPGWDRAYAVSFTVPDF